MRILTLSNSPLVKSQGSGYVITGYAKHLRNLGNEVDAFGPETIEPWKWIRKGKQYRQAVGILSVALRETRRKQYDILEFYGGEAWLAITMLSRVRQRSFLLVSHSNGIEPVASERIARYLGVSTPDGSRRKWYQWNQDRLLRQAFTRADKIVTVSDEERNAAISKGYVAPGDCLAVNNPLSPEFLGCSTENDRAPQVIGFCGGWSARKGNKVLVEDISRILEEFPRARLMLIGVGEQFCAQNHFAAGVLPRVEVFPFVNDKRELRELYSRMSIFVFPSVYESFGLSAAEAMACGCALVATRTGYAASLSHEVEALLIDEPSSPLLYDAVKRLITDEALRTRLAQNGYRQVQTLKWESASGTLDNVYRCWLEEAHRKAETKGNPCV